MSLWKSSIKRGRSGEIRKEDILPISVKITKKVPYYDWTTYYVQFKNDDTQNWIRWTIPFSKSNMKVDDILPILAENGLDIKMISIDRWDELLKGTNHYQAFRDWRDEQYKKAEQEGQTEKNRYLNYSFTTKKLRDSYYLVTVTMRMYGCWRKFKYVFYYDEDNWGYEDDETGKTRYTPIKEAINYDVEGMMDDITHTSLTEEEWHDNNTFKDLYSEARETIRRYRSGWWS